MFKLYQRIKRTTKDRNECLFDAIKENKLAEVVFLIKIGAAINPVDLTTSPLQIAIIEGHEKIAKTLISKGAKINRKDSRGYYLIHKAVQGNQKEIVEILLKNGADIEAECCFAKTPIYHAMDEANIEMIKILLRYGAKIDQPNELRHTPIEKAIFDNKKEIVEMFLKTKPNLNHPSFDSLLHKSVSDCDVEIVEMLIDYGLEIDSLNEYEETPIYLAITKNKKNPVQTTKLLLAKGASLNILDRWGYSPLECALEDDNEFKLDLIKVITYHQHSLKF